MNKNLIFYLLIILISTPLTNVFSYESTPDFDYMQGLRSENIHHRIFAKNELIQDKAVTIQETIKMVRNSDASTTDEDTTKYFAILLLGEFRAEKAIKVLSDNILFKVKLSTEFGLKTQEFMYAAAVALRKIGAPAVPQLISNIQHSDNAENRKLSAALIIEILGDLNESNIPLKKISSYEVKQYVGCETAKLLFQIQMQTYTDQKSSKRFSEALQYCDRYKRSTKRVKNALTGK